ncbi:MAG TPA: right-handed parallel beta-helix repeat-containing protein [Chitinivibrionales bacterium]
MNNSLYLYRNQAHAACGVVSLLIGFSVFSANAATIVVPTPEAATLTAAMLNAKSGDTVLAENGVYSERLLIKPGVTLMARSPCMAAIEGNGKGCLVIMGGGATICGFELRNATIGIRSNTADNAILECRITAMTESGISCAGQLPKIENNIIVYNKGSGIQGWDTRCTFSSLNHNTIAYNTNNGIAVGGHSTVIMENNIVAFNGRFGVKIDEDKVSIQMLKNIFFENTSMSYIKLDDNFTGNPLFVDPKAMNFQLQATSQCKQKGSDNKDIGALTDF